MSMFNQQRFVDMRSSGGGGGGGTVTHCQTAILDHNQSVHRALNELQGATSGGSNNNMKRSVSYGADPRLTSSTPPPPPADTDQSPLLGRQHRQQPYTGSIRSGGVPTLLEFYSNGFYSTLPEVAGGDKTIRFQVVVWHIGTIDLIQGRVPLTFRLTIFWNASPSSEEDLDGPPMDEAASNSASQKSQRTWKMLGRQKAYQDDRHVPAAAIEVPAVSILNVVTFDTIGEPEVSLLREDSKLMRWSCMYRATLFQEHWDVSDFPHDEHEISLRLAVLAHRKPGAQWDRNVWKLGLATADDAQGSLRAPEGLVVDHVSIPEFSYNKDEGLKFELKHLDHGPGGGAAHDTCLEVKLRVLRNSSYYDRNIMPLLGMLNFVAISITALEPERFFERGLLTLNIVSSIVVVWVDSLPRSSSLCVGCNQQTCRILILMAASLFFSCFDTRDCVRHLSRLECA